MNGYRILRNMFCVPSVIRSLKLYYRLLAEGCSTVPGEGKSGHCCVCVCIDFKGTYCERCVVMRAVKDTDPCLLTDRTAKQTPEGGMQLTARSWIDSKLVINSLLHLLKILFFLPIDRQVFFLDAQYVSRSKWTYLQNNI